MQLTILHMISNGSLSAFSASLANGGIGAARGVSPVQRVRSQAPAQQSGVNASPSVRQPPASAQPGQVLPRGSLLDLSV